MWVLASLMCRCGTESSPERGRLLGLSFNLASFNTVVLLVAGVVGLAAGLVGRVWPMRTRWGDLLLASMVGGVGSVLAVGATVLATDNQFAGTHIAYLIVTVGVPIGSALFIAGSANRRSAPALLAGLGLLAAPLGIYASHIEPFWLRLDEVRVAAPVPAAVGLRIGVLSDLQTTDIGDYENNAIDALLDSDPDIVVIPGDYWQMSGAEWAERHRAFAAALRRIATAADHVVAVSGDTDSLAGLRILAAGTDVHILDNETIELTVRGQAIMIGGLNVHGDMFPRQAVIDELAAADSNTVTMLLAHRPGVVREIPDESDIDLVIAGHTHGGQIQIPLIGPLVTASLVPRDVAAGGLHVLDGHTIYVSTGVGRERGYAPQVRFGARPSIGLIEFVAPTDAAPG